MAYPLLYTLSEATGVGIGVQRKTNFALLAAVVGLVLNAIANWFLVPKYGAAGAAVASAVAFLSFFIVRTEASALLWQSFERSRMYILVVSMVILSGVVNFLPISSIVMFFIYLMVLVSAVFLFRKQFFESLEYILSFVRNRKSVDKQIKN